MNKSVELKTSGRNAYIVHFSSLSAALRSIVEVANKRLWIFIDEWSAIPDELQPYLADVLRRVLFPQTQVSVVIAAIEHRSRFQLSSGASYIGMEIGADCATSINLDDFMVFDSNPGRARKFFESMIFRHFSSVDAQDLEPEVLGTPESFFNEAFTQKTFDELIRAAEGVPRDAINILSIAARRAGDKKINIKDVRFAASQWFEQDKSRFLRQNKDAEALLAWVVDRVLGQKRARAFLVESGARNKLLDELYDGRVLHVLKRSVAAHDQPGRRYIVYKIDYGCYVDVLTGARSPQGLLPSITDDGAETYVEVPPDDYRSIRLRYSICGNSMQIK